MRKAYLIGASVLAVIVASNASAQTPTPSSQSSSSSAAGVGDNGSVDNGIADIVVTAQRQSESLQQVPIAVSAFSAEALRAQQINTTSDLQLTLPNISFTKGNFTSSSSFNIRGIGDLCVGVTCDAATSSASRCCAVPRALCLVAMRRRA